MAQEDIAAKAEAMAIQYERQYGGCAQCVIAALKDTIGGVSDEVFKSATGLGGGIGGCGEHACGCLVAGVLVLSLFCGREYDNFADPDGIRWKTRGMVTKLRERFKETYGGGDCRNIQTKIMGRCFNLLDEKDHRDFLAAGGHDDKCPIVVGKASRWVVEILREENLI